MPWPSRGIRTRSRQPFPAPAGHRHAAATRPLPRGKTLNRSGARTPVPPGVPSRESRAAPGALRRPAASGRRAGDLPSSILVGIVALVPDLHVVGEDRLVLLDLRLLVQVIEPGLVE